MESLPRIARWYRDMLGIQAVYVKHSVKDRDAAQPKACGSGGLLIGKPAPERIEIQERGLKFVIRPHEGVSVGLFLDHRENRGRIRAMARGKDVLNLFAHTCGFSVAAAAGGARCTVSVDISPRYLQWGQANFELNGLDGTNHRFVRADALDHLRQAKRQGMWFDLIVLDPPTFAHGRKRKQQFSITDDLVDLTAASVAVLRPGGVLMLSTSYRRLSIRSLRAGLRQAAGRRRCDVLDVPPLPPDFAMDPDHAKTIFTRFE
jgi:23S rRNA (cytosine1962-C5)-methyltransferase